MAQPKPRLAAAAAVAAALWAGALAAQPMPKGPSWGELSPQERQVLAPLNSDWENMDLMRRNKWREIARRYPTMQESQQRRLEERMEAWSRLSSQERQAARERFKALSPERRQELSNQWLEYQNLPQEQRQQLRQAPRPPPPGGRPSAPPVGRPSAPPAPPGR